MDQESGVHVHVTFVQFLIARLQDIVRLEPEPRRDLVPDGLAARVYGRDKLLPTPAAYGQTAKVLPIDPLGVMQHVDHLAEREERVAVAARGDAPDRAQRVEHDKVER